MRRRHVELFELDNIVVDLNSEGYKGREYEIENEFVECAKAMMWILFIFKDNYSYASVIFKSPLTDMAGFRYRNYKVFNLKTVENLILTYTAIHATVPIKLKR